MTGQNAHIALGAGQVHLIDLAGEQHVLGRNKLKMHCGHLIPTRRTASAKKRTGPMPYSLFR